MRLTLRTLLAYLDDVLEPSLQKEIGQKIQASSTATSLVGRIRDVIRRRRLNAPGFGPGELDPNLVAEYLDNTLPPDAVAEIEKICLESDAHLAETAAAHQILALVLGEPIDPPPLLRERLYALAPSAAPARPAVLAGQRPSSGTIPTADSGSRPASGTIPVSTPAASQAEEPKAAAETAGAAAPAAFQESLPDYLKRSPWGRRFTAAAVVAALGAVWLASVYFDRWPQGDPLRTVADRGGAAATPNGGDPGTQDDQGPGVENTEPAPAPDAGSAVAKSTGSDSKTKAPARTGAAAAKTAGTKTPRDPAPPPDAPDEPETPAEPAKAASKGTGPAEDETKTASAGAAGEGTTPAPGVPTMPESRPMPPVAAELPMLYDSRDGILLRGDLVDEHLSWFVMPRRAVVRAGERLGIPEPFEAQFKVEDRHRIAIHGRTDVELFRPERGAAVGLGLHRGRVVLQAADQAVPWIVAVAVGGEVFQLELLTPEAACGVEIAPRLTEEVAQDFGADAWRGGVYVTAGTVRVTGPEGRSVEVAGPLTLDLSPATRQSDSTAYVPTQGKLPDWLVRRSGSIHPMARPFELAFSNQVSAESALITPAKDRRPELARLAVSCYGLMGNLEALIEAMDRNEHEEARLEAIDHLRYWLTQGEEALGRIRAILGERFPPEDAKTIERLLWGYGEPDARNKTTSKELVDWLESDVRCIRELAFMHIRRLTKRAWTEYRPSAQPTNRRAGVQSLRRYLERDGTLLPEMRRAEPMPESR